MSAKFSQHVELAPLQITGIIVALRFHMEALEKRMQEIVKSGQRFSRRVVSEDDARAELAHEPYKLELIGLKGGKYVFSS